MASRPPRLYRVIIPVSNIDHAARFYTELLGIHGERVSPGRHYFDCGGTIAACFDPRADTDDFDAKPNPDHIYFAVDDLAGVFERAKRLDCQWLEDAIKTRPWGEHSFYARDPFGNPICFVDSTTIFSGSAKMD